MKTNDLLLLGAVGVGAFFLFSKKATGTGALGQEILDQGQKLADAERREAVMRTQVAEAKAEAEEIKSIFSPLFQEKIRNTTEAEWQEAFSIGTPQYGTSPVVGPEESARNLETIRSTGGFREIRSGVYRRDTGGGISGGGSTRVIYT